MRKPAFTEVGILPALAERWSPCAISPEPVPEEALKAMFEAARWAPSAYNEQPWRWVIATSEDPVWHAQLAALIMPGNRVWAERAPVLILTAAKERYSHNGQSNPYAWHDLGMATAQLSAEATARGLVVHQMAGFFADAARAQLQIPPEYTPVSMLAVGFPGRVEELPENLRPRDLAPRKRKEIQDLVFNGRWPLP